MRQSGKAAWVFEVSFVNIVFIGGAGSHSGGHVSKEQ